MCRSRYMQHADGCGLQRFLDLVVEVSGQQVVAVVGGDERAAATVIDRSSKAYRWISAAGTEATISV